MSSLSCLIRTTGSWLRAAPFFLTLLVLVASPSLAAEELIHGEGLLWKVEVPGTEVPGTRPSYIFGTIHSADERVTNLPPAIVRVFDSANSLTVEVAMTEEVMIEAMRAVALAPGRDLEGIVGTERFQEIVRLAERYGMGPDQLNRMKPWAVTVVFSLPPADVGDPLRSLRVLDFQLQLRAASQGRSVYSLETVGEQLSIFDGMSEADQIAFLDAAMVMNPEIEAFTEELLQKYIRRDLKAIFDMMLEQSAATDERLLEAFLDRVLYVRNERMVTRMQAQLARGNAFVAVGALHLPGEQGVLHLLEQEGYRVLRVY